MDKCFTSYLIEDRSFVAFVKRDIHSLLLQTNFTKTRVAEIDIIVSELTSNLIKHAGSGELLCRINDTDADATLEIITIDNGPGMSDVQYMMKDGVSTTQTLGHGLGAIQRLSNFFSVYSLPKWGTVSYTVVESQKQKTHRANGLDVNALCIPHATETVCGDGYGVKKNGNLIHVFLADGLGHGKNAHEAAYAAYDFFLKTNEVNPSDIIRQMHTAVRKTRGLVASVASLDTTNKVWRFCGVGNISTRLYGGIMFKHYMPYNGIIGLNIPNSMNDTIIPAEKNQQLIMCSDGIRTRWDLSKYPSILKYDPMLLAAALYKDFTRRTDDSSVFIAKVSLDK